MSHQAIVYLVVLIPSVILHEISHGVVALAFGDDTAKRAGRLTLNPIAHIDPFGTILLPLILALGSGGVFGYAKPVPVDPRRLRNPRQQSLLVSLAGPATNLLIAFAASVVYVAGPRNDWTSGFIVVNVILAAFNLLPIPPLDGSALVERVLPRQWWPAYLRFRQYSMGLVLIVVLLLPNVLGHLFDWALRTWIDNVLRPLGA
ncbi:MAG: peptidase [Acidimicrobiales bacterium]|nr:peptidase [Acidimicrobiales bacterium]